MFGGLSAANVDDRDVAAEALGEGGVVFDVDFAEGAWNSRRSGAMANLASSQRWQPGLV